MYQQLIDQVRMFETDHTPDGYPAVQMQLLTALADELAKAKQDTARIEFLATNSVHVLSIGSTWYSRTGYQKPMHKMRDIRSAIDAARTME